VSTVRINMLEVEVSNNWCVSRVDAILVLN